MTQAYHMKCVWFSLANVNKFCGVISDITKWIEIVSKNLIRWKHIRVLIKCIILVLYSHFQFFLVGSFHVCYLKTIFSLLSVLDDWPKVLQIDYQVMIHVVEA